MRAAARAADYLSPTSDDASDSDSDLQNFLSDSEDDLPASRPSARRPGADRPVGSDDDLDGLDDDDHEMDAMFKSLCAEMGLDPSALTRQELEQVLAAAGISDAEDLEDEGEEAGEEFGDKPRAKGGLGEVRTHALLSLCWCCSWDEEKPQGVPGTFYLCMGACVACSCGVRR